ncbi:MAG: P-loop NTPase fold protein [Pseudonocardiaceae bacterium]
MDAVAALYRELDPLRPLAADDDALYVDWQHKLDPGTVDVKSRLVRAFVRNATPQRPITRLLTGHKGSGKTTELNRVASALHSGQGGKKVFVSTLYAQRWLDIEDVQPEDLVLQLVRQLVADLQVAGMEFGVQRFRGFFESLRDRFRGTRLETVELGADPLKFSFALNDFPIARREFRDLLRGQLPKVNDLVNRELLPEARNHLAAHGFQDIVLVIDDLDKIPQKVLSDQGLTNHENLFLDNAAKLRAISCSLLMTIPIELAYSPAQGRLRDDYGAAIGTIPLVTVADRAGVAVRRGEDALAEVVGRRARVAFDEPAADPVAAAKRIFAEPADLTRVLRLSGGHLRSLLVMLTELLDWVDELPVQTATLDRYLPRAAKDLARGLLPEAKEVLRTVAAGKEAAGDPRFFELLRNHYVFAYEAGEEEYWYDINPLLRAVAL